VTLVVQKIAPDVPSGPWVSPASRCLAVCSLLPVF